MTQVAFTWRHTAPRALRRLNYSWGAECKNGHKLHDCLDARGAQVQMQWLLLVNSCVCCGDYLFSGQFLSNQRGSLEVSEVRSPTTGHTGPFVLDLNYRCFRSSNSIAAGIHVDLFSSSLKWTFRTIIIITFDPIIELNSPALTVWLHVRCFPDTQYYKAGDNPLWLFGWFLLPKYFFLKLDVCHVNCSPEKRRAAHPKLQIRRPLGSDSSCHTVHSLTLFYLKAGRDAGFSIDCSRMGSNPLNWEGCSCEVWERRTKTTSSICNYPPQPW